MPLDKEMLERLIEASPDIVVATDEDGTVQYYNDGARENLGYSGATSPRSTRRSRKRGES